MEERLRGRRVGDAPEVLLDENHAPFLAYNEEYSPHHRRRRSCVRAGGPTKLETNCFRIPALGRYYVLGESAASPRSRSPFDRFFPPVQFISSQLHVRVPSLSDIASVSVAQNGKTKTLRKPNVVALRRRNPPPPPPPGPSRRRRATRKKRHGMTSCRCRWCRPWRTPTKRQSAATCAGTGSRTNNPILFCETCDVAVHKGCYGIVRIPTGDWNCKACVFKKKNPSKRARCCLCPTPVGR